MDTANITATTLDADLLNVDLTFDETSALRKRLADKLMDAIENTTLNLGREDFDITMSQIRAFDSMSSLLNDIDKNAHSRAALKLKKKDSDSTAKIAVNVTGLMEAIHAQKGKPKTVEEFEMDERDVQKRIDEALEKQGVIILDEELMEDNDATHLAEDVRKYMKDNGMI